MGIYAQDKWTFKRATINAGLRFDYFKNSFPGAAPRARPRSCRTGTSRFPGRTYANLKDITPRVGVAYDLFGNGKTSLKSSWGKYMLGAEPAGTGNPISLLSTTANRSGRPACRSGIRTTTPRSAT